MVKAFVICLSLFASVNVMAEIITERASAKFDPVWKSLRQTISAFDYKVAYIQKCDFALRERSYKSDKYRILFFANHESMDGVVQNNPSMAPFLPLKIVLMEEGDHTLMVVKSPINYNSMISDIASERELYKWDRDIRQILTQVKQEHQK